MGIETFKQQNFYHVSVLQSTKGVKLPNTGAIKLLRLMTCFAPIISNNCYYFIVKSVMLTQYQCDIARSGDQLSHEMSYTEHCAESSPPLW